MVKPPIHLTLLALAELAPAARWWGTDLVTARRACDWVRPDDEGHDVFRPDARRDLNRITCPECLVMLDWALEHST